MLSAKKILKLTLLISSLLYSIDVEFLKILKFWLSRHTLFCSITTNTIIWQSTADSYANTNLHSSSQASSLALTFSRALQSFVSLLLACRLIHNGTKMCLFFVSFPRLSWSKCTQRMNPLQGGVIFWKEVFIADERDGCVQKTYWLTT